MSSSERSDQATLAIFRILIFVQLLAAAFFGLLPYVLPGTFASGAGFTGREPFIYRLAGAATLGYAVTALFGLLRPAWYRLRIPMVATLTFNAAAVIGSLVSLASGETQFVVLFVAVAASAFTLIAGYWLIRDDGPADPAPAPIEPWFRGVIAVATLAAAFFGLAPLVAPGQFASIAGFSTDDIWIYRLAGAATLGYATAGVLSLRARTRDEVALQTRAALTFNALSAIAALLYVLAGGRSPVAYLIGVAATAFSIAFIVWLSGGRRRA
jgi:hypothetical protein